MNLAAEASMLDPDELADVAAEFGVDDDQVRRDHLISHILHALANIQADQLLFFGGTALARTHVLNGRLSEDIDLSCPNRAATAAIVQRELPRALRREFPAADWAVQPVGLRDIEPALLQTRDGLQVRIQLLSAEHMFNWPAETRPIDVRYTDVPAITLRVPTLPAFVAMKTIAWADRRAERDLYDLDALARQGAINKQAADLAAAATGVRVAPHMFDHPPGDQRWREQLAHQTRQLPDPAECLARVRRAYSCVTQWFDHE
ncbi:nucleotidyl transferase AbiEii/AbiGii toxin family protein [Actinomadura spongiicola]|uniref:Nucleotidyl transferase AbiEii/AbiGii toxin family protein n=1 Tax=Actinomadura spongiicola TaxID=2303421 RepID=A0A372G7Q6_9ACTN|nr:nucleotidyl transferase AbiEii/AbiGii toxin family protein [Actinomadura spongiicola]RFS81428.1 nucleotidyl transferase AbiEii/AbiGii toxin family protein [Actinomadura spongiicola]